MDFAKVSSGLDLGLKKAMASEGGEGAKDRTPRHTCVYGSARSRAMSHRLEKSIKGMDGCFPTSYRQPFFSDTLISRWLVQSCETSISRKSCLICDRAVVYSYGNVGTRFGDLIFFLTLSSSDFGRDTGICQPL